MDAGSRGQGLGGKVLGAYLNFHLRRTFAKAWDQRLDRPPSCSRKPAQHNCNRPPTACALPNAHC